MHALAHPSKIPSILPSGAWRRLLLVSLAKPPLTKTEVTWKKGAPHARPCSP